MTRQITQEEINLLIKFAARSFQEAVMTIVRK